jgi:hypothetical protein
MNELSVLFGIILVLLIGWGLLIMYGDTNPRVLLLGLVLFSFAGYLTVYIY